MVTVLDMNAGHANVGVQAILDAVRASGHEARVVDVRRGEPLPSFPQAVIGTGGPGGPADGGPGIAETEDLLARCLHLGVPVLGICFTFQLMARAAGAEVRPLPDPRMGVSELSGRSRDRWLGPVGVGPVFENRRLGVFGQGDFRPLEREGEQVLAARFGHHAVGCVFHPEADPDSVRVFLANREHIPVDPSGGDLYSAAAERLARTREVLLGGWLAKLPRPLPA